MNELTQTIKSLIHKSGHITFAKFMELALYHPNYGYYASGKAKIGKEGDYYTSSSVHPAFGEVLGRFICRAWELVAVSDFTVIEMGAGKGFLSLDILDSIKRNNPTLYDRLSYLIIELSPQLREEGKATLREHLSKIKWVDFLTDLKLESISGVFISNELVDSLPFHRAKLKNRKLQEIFVGLRDEDFVEFIGEPSSLELKEYFKGYDLEFEDEQEVEINLKAREWLSDISSVLSKGLVLTVDYGFLTPELYSSIRMKGTFRCFHKHTLNENPYLNIGEQDITAHVNFSDLIRTGDSLGLSTIKYITQGQFLVDWGILDIIERYSSSDISSEKSRLAIKNLFLPELMGERFKVLIQSKNLENKIRTFYPESPFRISFQSPLDRYKGL
ncbi:MAG: SAM-dependent methyltransferase [Deltaproteobacteria bacterium]|nr:SAM-dependent methyltransferase [Deltaproteobacteria bacterium]